MSKNDSPASDALQIVRPSIPNMNMNSKDTSLNNLVDEGFNISTDGNGDHSYNVIKHDTIKQNEKMTKSKE